MLAPIPPGVSNKRDSEQVEEELDELEYDQFFLGVLKREPAVLKGKVQKAIVRFSSQPPRSTRLRFRFNQLNSKFQVYRNQWGRILRQIEAGTYKPLAFRARLHQREQESAPAASYVEDTPRGRTASIDATSTRRTGIDQLCEALERARKETGKTGDPLDREHVQRLIRQQTAALRARHGDVKVRFRVVVEGNKARLRASVNRDSS